MELQTQFYTRYSNILRILLKSRYTYNYIILRNINSERGLEPNKI